MYIIVSISAGVAPSYYKMNIFYLNLETLYFDIKHEEIKT